MTLRFIHERLSNGEAKWVVLAVWGISAHVGKSHFSAELQKSLAKEEVPVLRARNAEDLRGIFMMRSPAVDSFREMSGNGVIIIEQARFGIPGEERASEERDMNFYEGNLKDNLSTVGLGSNFEVVWVCIGSTNNPPPPASCFVKVDVVINNQDAKTKPSFFS